MKYIFKVCYGQKEFEDYLSFCNKWGFKLHSFKVQHNVDHYMWGAPQKIDVYRVVVEEKE